MNYDPELDFPIDINNIVDALDALNWNNIRVLSEEKVAALHMISHDIRHKKLEIKSAPQRSHQNWFWQAQLSTIGH